MADEAVVLLEARNLTKRYDSSTLALDALNLKVHAGEIYGLLGANGAGKTTTINLFMSFIEPTTGNALVCGTDATADPLEAKRHLAYVSENVMLYGSFTARQNLEIFTRLAGRPADRRRLDDVMRRVGLPEHAFSRRAASFSKGMRQKLGIAIAILKDAEVLLLDEPTSGLDPKAASDLGSLLVELAAEGKAILMSTHDIFRVHDVASTVGIMREGRLVMERSSDELRHSDLEQVYLDYFSAQPRSPGKGGDPAISESRA